MKYIVYLLHNPGEFDLGGKQFYEVVPMIELRETYLFSDPSENPPSVLGSHLNYDLLKDYVVKQKVKTIHIRRDPRDVLVSFFNFYRMNIFFGPFEGSWDDFYDLYKNKELLCGDIIDHMNAWCKEKQHSNILYISYEDMKDDLKSVIAKIATFCDVEVTEEQINCIAENSSFEKMNDNYSVNGQLANEKGIFDFTKAKFMRKGIVGDWKEYFNEQQIEHMSERLEGTQYAVSDTL